MKSDIIIIGAGPGGYETALYAASKGLSVTLFERDNVGGTCLNRGCIPTKTLCHSAEIVDNIRSAQKFGIEVNVPKIDFAAVISHKDEVVAQLRTGVETMLKAPLISLVRGEAEITAPHEVVCNGENYKCDNIIIATGSKPRYLEIEGVHQDGVLTSDEILELDSLPHSLCVIGGGVIGMEFACVFNSMGVDVTVVEYCKEIIPNIDKDISKRLKQLLSRRGINIMTGTAVEAIESTTEGLLTKCLQKDKPKSVLSEKVLIAVGRQPQYPEGLDAVGVTHSRRGISVDENMATNIVGIYAIGDVNGVCMLAHAATQQGRRAVNNILNIADGIKFDIIPSVVFTVPEAASVGFTEERCEELGMSCRVVKSFYRSNGRAVTMDDTDGVVKLIVNDDSQIIGAHIVGAHAADLIHEITVLMNLKAKADDYKTVIHAHPTLSEILQTAFEQIEKKETKEI